MDGGCGAVLLPITGYPFVDCTPSSKSIISVISFDLKSSVEIYIVYVLPTDILLNDELNPTLVEKFVFPGLVVVLSYT